MELIFSFLAKSAEVGTEGSFHVLGGGIHALAFQSVPAQAPAVAVVASLHFPPDECGSHHRVRLTVTRPDGTDGGLDAFVDLSPTRADQLADYGSSLQVAINIFGLLLPEVGRYRFNFLSRDTQIGTLEFLVVLTPQPLADGGHT